MHVTGTHSVLPEGTEAQLNTYLNGYLLDSQLLDDQDPSLTIEATADSSPRQRRERPRVHADHGRRRTDCAGPPGAADPGLLRRHRLDRDRDARPGQHDRLRRVPPGARRRAAGRDPPGRARPRARPPPTPRCLISSLQRAASMPIAVDLVDPDEFLAEQPLGPARRRRCERRRPPSRRRCASTGCAWSTTPRRSSASAPTSPSRPSRRSPTGGRHVLMLGGWSPDVDDAGLGERPARRGVVRRHPGLGRAHRRPARRQRRRPPFTLSSNSVVPQVEVADERRGFIRWLVLGFVVLRPAAGLPGACAPPGATARPSPRRRPGRRRRARPVTSTRP